MSHFYEDNKMQTISKGERNRALKAGIDQLRQEGWELQYRGTSTPNPDLSLDGDIVTAYAVMRHLIFGWGTLMRTKYEIGHKAAWHHYGCIEGDRQFGIQIINFV